MIVVNITVHRREWNRCDSCWKPNWLIYQLFFRIKFTSVKFFFLRESKLFWFFLNKVGLEKQVGKYKLFFYKST